MFSTGLVHIVRKAIMEHPTEFFTTKLIHEKLSAEIPVTLLQVRKMISQLRASKSSRHLVQETGKRIEGSCEKIWRKSIRGLAKKIPVVRRKATPTVEVNGDAPNAFEVGEGILKQIQTLRDRDKMWAEREKEWAAEEIRLNNELVAKETIIARMRNNPPAPQGQRVFIPAKEWTGDEFYLRICLKK